MKVYTVRLEAAHEWLSFRSIEVESWAENEAHAKEMVLKFLRQEKLDGWQVFVWESVEA